MQTPHPGGGERCVTDRGHALRKVLISEKNQRCRCGCVRRSDLQEDSCEPSQGLRPEGVRRSVPAGTATGSILPFRQGNCGTASERTSYGSPLGTTQVQVSEVEGGSGVPP